jgi:hypothetical protein
VAAYVSSNSIYFIGRSYELFQKNSFIIWKMTYTENFGRIYGHYDKSTYLRAVRPIQISGQESLSTKYADLMIRIDNSQQEYLENVRIDGSLFSTKIYRGISVINSSAETFIRNCIIRGISYKNETSAAYFHVKTILFLDSLTIIDNDAPGIVLHETIYMNISNCEISRNLYGIVTAKIGKAEGKDYNLIENNIISGNDNDGIYITDDKWQDDAGDTWGGMYYTNIQDNQITNNGGWGIVIEKGNDINIRRNNLCNNGKGGIAYNPFDSIYFEDNQCAGFSLQGLVYVAPGLVYGSIGGLIALLAIPILIKSIKKRGKVPKLKLKGEKSLKPKADDFDFDSEFNLD